jgi:hypothetical protein
MVISVEKEYIILYSGPAYRISTFGFIQDSKKKIFLIFN